MVCDTFLNCLVGSWQYAEPIIGYSAIFGAIIYWIRLQAARRRRYCNKGGKEFIVVVQVGRPVVEAAKAYFEDEIDALIDAQAILKKVVLEGRRDYEQLVREFNRAIAPQQNNRIKVILSGPVGLSAMLGQSVGLQYDIVFFQYDAAERIYVELPQVERTWIRQ